MWKAVRTLCELFALIFVMGFVIGAETQTEFVLWGVVFLALLPYVFRPRKEWLRKPDQG
jgi:hypothetical protein